MAGTWNGGRKEGRRESLLVLYYTAIGEGQACLAKESHYSCYRWVIESINISLPRGGIRLATKERWSNRSIRLFIQANLFSTLASHTDVSHRTIVPMPISSCRPRHAPLYAATANQPTNQPTTNQWVQWAAKSWHSLDMLPSSLLWSGQLYY